MSGVNIYGVSNTVACHERTCALARANRVFRTDEKRIRTENTVMDKSTNGFGLLLSKIVDCVRMGSSSVRNRRSARTGRRPRKFDRSSSMYPPASAYVGVQPLRAARANHVFHTDEKHIRMENTVIDKNHSARAIPNKGRLAPAFRSA